MFDDEEDNKSSFMTDERRNIIVLIASISDEGSTPFADFKMRESSAIWGPILVCSFRDRDIPCMTICNARFSWMKDIFSLKSTS